MRAKIRVGDSTNILTAAAVCTCICSRAREHRASLDVQTKIFSFLFSPFLKMSVIRLPQSPLKVLQPSSKANQNLMKPQILNTCLPDSTDENQDVSTKTLKIPKPKVITL